jgi:hypothetical protein
VVVAYDDGDGGLFDPRDSSAFISCTVIGGGNDPDPHMIKNII